MQALIAHRRQLLGEISLLCRRRSDVEARFAATATATATATAAAASPFDSVFPLQSSPASAKISAIAVAAADQHPSPLRNRIGRRGTPAKGAVVTAKLRPRLLELLRAEPGCSFKITAKLDGTGCYIGPLTLPMARFIAARTAGTLVDDQLSIDFGSGRIHALTVGMVHAWRRLDVKLKPTRSARAKRGKPGGDLGAASSGVAKPALTTDTAAWQYTLRPGWFPSAAPSFNTGHWVGFRPVCPSEPEKHFLEAMDPVARHVNVLGPTGSVQAVSFDDVIFAGGCSVELLGPKVNGNKHELKHHLVAVHGAIVLGSAPELVSILAPCADGAFDITRVRDWLSRTPQYEGVVVWAELRDGSREYFKLHRGHLGLKQDWGEALFPVGQRDPPNLATPLVLGGSNGH